MSKKPTKALKPDMEAVATSTEEIVSHIFELPEGTPDRARILTEEGADLVMGMANLLLNADTVALGRGGMSDFRSFLFRIHAEALSLKELQRQSDHPI